MAMKPWYLKEAPGIYDLYAGYNDQKMATFYDKTAADGVLQLLNKDTVFVDNDVARLIGKLMNHVIDKELPIGEVPYMITRCDIVNHAVKQMAKQMLGSEVNEAKS